MSATNTAAIEFTCDYPGCEHKTIVPTGRTPQGYFGTVYQTLKSGKATRSNWYACKPVHMYRAILAVLREET